MVYYYDSKTHVSTATSSKRSECADTPLNDPYIVYVTVRTYLCGLIDDTIADGDAHEVDAHLVRGTDECGANKGRGEERRGGESS